MIQCPATDAAHLRPWCLITNIEERKTSFSWYSRGSNSSFCYLKSCIIWIINMNNNIPNSTIETKKEPWCRCQTSGNSGVKLESHESTVHISRNISHNEGRKGHCSSILQQLCLLCNQSSNIEVQSSSPTHSTSGSDPSSCCAKIEFTNQDVHTNVLASKALDP